MSKTATIHVEDDFKELGSKTLDQRNRIALNIVKKLPYGVKRVKVYVNIHGEILIRPMVEIPASEAWLFKNKEALASVKRGLEQSEKGEISELDIESLD